MNEKNDFLFNNVENPDHWKISEIILDQCKKYPKREIIEFIDGPKWNFHDLKIKSLEKAKILKEKNLLLSLVPWAFQMEESDHNQECEFHNFSVVLRILNLILMVAFDHFLLKQPMLGL